MLGGLLLCAWALNRQVHALAWWGSAFWFIVLGLSVVTIGRPAPAPLALLAGNAFVAAAYGLQYTGCRAVNRRPISVPAALVGALVWIIAWPLIAERQGGRVILLSLIVGAYCYASVWELWRHAPKPLHAQRFAIGLVLVSATFYLLRASGLRSVGQFGGMACGIRQQVVG